MAFTTVLILGAVGAVVVHRNRQHRHQALCTALNAEVVGLPEIEEAIDASAGMSRSGPTWDLVLTEGVRETTVVNRAQIAAAVRGDTEGFERLLDRSPQRLRPALHRQRDLASDAERSFMHWNDPQVAADALQIGRFGSDECNLDD